ncbi:aquaporin-like protein [Coniella lustricola]|uniref:Aquaporin-like protein n=1 Tax=Coniella lustricola TaxID=2025994 RepID=A0A2T3AL23_9PEZI|nr:aquaporin-like protein [Coniella lustricola]
MIPTKTEILQQAPQQAEHEKQAQEEFDLEAGRVESSLNPNKISDALRTAQQDREFRLLRRYTGQNVGGPDLGRRSSVASNQARPSLSDRFGKIDRQNSVAGSHTANLGKLDSVQEQRTPDEGEHANEEGWLADHAGADTPVHDGSEPEEWVEDPDELKPYDPELDEIHNLHTYWSVIRLKFREPLAELLAMTCQLTIGFAADLVVTTSGSSATTNANWAWGLASMIGIYIAGGISGAHLNPAVSIMLWIFRGFPLRKIPGYAFAQLLGAFLASLIAFGLYRTSIIEFAGNADMATSGTSSAFVTHPQHSYIDASTAFFTEFVGTAILAVVVLALGDDSNAPPGAGMNAFIMGLVITVLLMAFGANTGLALNPARDFGPRLALLALGYGKANTFPSAYWFWGAWCGPIAGALFGAFLYDGAIFVGGESPVNYPRKRIKRAMRKKKAKWGRRFKKVATGGLSVPMPLRRPRYASDDWHFDHREDESVM